VARKKKPSGRLRNGPFDFAEFEKAIEADGWVPDGHGDHPNYKHPTKRGKVQLDKKWTGLKKGQTAFRGVASQAEMTQKELIKLLND
jgi:hypothetical protein